MGGSLCCWVEGEGEEKYFSLDVFHHFHYMCVCVCVCVCVCMCGMVTLMLMCVYCVRVCVCGGAWGCGRTCPLSLKLL